VSTKRTPWFPGNVPPAREGDYEYRFLIGMTGKHCAPRRMRWSNGEWSMGFTKGAFGSIPGDEWRGLASNPEAS
jgi:hypothetical protein